MSSAIITSWADWLGNIVIICHKHPSSVDPVIISPVFSIGASVAIKVWSIRCPVWSGVLPLSRPAIIKVLIYCIVALITLAGCSLLSVLDQETMQATGRHSDWFMDWDWDKLYEDLQSWIFLFNKKQQKRSERHVSYQFTRWNKNVDRHFFVQIVNNTDKHFANSALCTVSSLNDCFNFSIWLVALGNTEIRCHTLFCLKW